MTISATGVWVFTSRWTRGCFNRAMMALRRLGRAVEARRARAHPGCAEPSNRFTLYVVSSRPNLRTKLKFLSDPFLNAIAVFEDLPRPVLALPRPVLALPRPVLALP